MRQDFGRAHPSEYCSPTELAATLVSMTVYNLSPDLHRCPHLGIDASIPVSHRCQQTRSILRVNSLEPYSASQDCLLFVLVRFLTTTHNRFSFCCPIASVPTNIAGAVAQAAKCLDTGKYTVFMASDTDAGEVKQLRAESSSSVSAGACSVG